MTSSNRPSLLTSIGAALAASFVAVFTAGCALQSGVVGTSSPISVASAATGTSGRVHGGQQPVSGAVIQLYEIGTTGYTSGAKGLISTAVGGPQTIAGKALTDASGSFDVTGAYTCDAGSYVYITASGGNPGLAAGTNNAAIAMMAALGPCSSLGAATYVSINEVTTVAGAYALAQFSSGFSWGTALTGSTTPSDSFATSSTNVQGAANAMSVANVLASYSTGTSPGNNSNGSASPEWWQVNTIADILATCVNSASATASACTTLFSNVTPVGGIAPADTLQAAVALALAPTLTTAKIASLYNLASATSPFQPYVTTAGSIRDFSIGITYTPVLPGTTTNLLKNGAAVATAALQPTYSAIDAYGNVWVESSTSGGTTTGSGTVMVELDPTGNPIPVGSACTSGCTVSNFAVSSYNNQASGVTNNWGYNNYSVIPQFALDTNNNVWATDNGTNCSPSPCGGKVVKIPGSSAVGGANGGNTAVGYTVNATSVAGGPGPVTVDGANNVFYAIQNGNGSVNTACGAASTTISQNQGISMFPSSNPASITYLGYQLRPANSLAIDGGQTSTGTNFDTSGGTAIPGAPFLWATNNTGPTLTKATGTATGTDQILTHFTTTTSNGGTACITPLAKSATGTAFGIASQGSVTAASIDGSSAFNFTGTTNQPLTSLPLNTFGTTQGAAGGDAAVMMNTAKDLAFDNSGNLWIPNTNYVNYQGTSLSSLTKLTPNYGSPATPGTLVPATAAAVTTYKNFISGGSTALGGVGAGVSLGGMGVGSGTTYPQFVAVDGNSNVWFSLNGGNVGALTTNGAPLSPNVAGGFFGSTCTNCVFNGAAAKTYNRTTSAGAKLSIDGSGNVWLPQPGAYDVLQLVGIAAPTVTPLSVGLANHTLATKP